MASLPVDVKAKAMPTKENAAKAVHIV